MLFMLLMMFTISMLFPWMKHPLSMGMMLILQTMTISLISGMMTNSFWFSYMLFIIILGGALVLFIYMASIASNMKFYFSFKMMLYIIFMMMVSMMIWLMIDSMMINKINMIYTNQFMENEQILSLMKMFNTKTMLLTIMLVIYLLFTMIVITFITNIYEGPMRMKN
uniref:NADH-ubiquinone oxidoreductase chain 6 n=1 Tax=Enithares tibialis TaxID=575841 RepID=C5HIU9_9HEMI|nr:NADH dehydrogenase subunit 6 [Enithares tibialis]ACJ69544.1 NADH dehydrogenase subunit 6 [Enithares tibialis]